MSAGYGTHLEARREVLTPGRTPDFCLFSQVVQKKRLRQPYPEYCIRMLLNHSSRCGFTPYLLRMGIQNRFSGTVNTHLNHKTCDWKSLLPPHFFHEKWWSHHHLFRFPNWNQGNLFIKEKDKSCFLFSSPLALPHSTEQILKSLLELITHGTNYGSFLPNKYHLFFILQIRDTC